MIGVAVLGYGTVGSGVYDVINENNNILAKRIGKEIEVLHVLDLREFPNDSVTNILTHDFNDILSDEKVNIVAEVMGGIEPAYTFSKQAIMAGKSVVTSNKSLVAEHGPELMELAKKHNVSYLFEASVGGCIPIIRPLCVSLTADDILEISGILNGTTNYILTKMTQEGLSFDEVLKSAQDLGYAEADPTADVEGHDACRKIAILSSLAYDNPVNFKDIYTEGITKIADLDIEYAKAINSTIKLIASSKKTANGLAAKVCPLVLNNEHPLSTINGVYNAVFVKGNMSGNTMYFGSGAGKLPTASAVVADIVDAAKNPGKTVEVYRNCSSVAKVEPVSNVETRALIRVAFDNKEIAKVSCKEVFGEIEFIEIGKADELALITNFETEEVLMNKKALIATKNGVKEVRNLIRMEG